MKNRSLSESMVDDRWGGGAILIKIIRPLDETLVLQRTVGISCFQIK